MLSVFLYIIAIILFLVIYRMLWGSLLAYVIFFLLIAGVTGYVFVYKRHLNAALNGEQRKRRRMPPLYQVAVVILAVICAVAMLHMSAQITALNNQVANLTNSVNMLQQDVQSMYADLSYRLEQQGSLVSSIACDYGDYDAERQTAELIFAVVPKSVSDQMQVTLSVGGAQTALTQSGAGIYTGTLSVGIFEDGGTAILTLEEDGVKQTQAIDSLNVGALWEYYLPGICAECHETDEKEKDGAWTRTWDVDVSCYPAEYGGGTFETLRLITLLNDAVIGDEDLLSRPAEGNLSEGLSIEFEMEQTYKDTDSLLIYVEATDAQGLIYRVVLYEWADKMEAGSLEAADIYDADGNHLLSYDF